MTFNKSLWSSANENWETDDLTYKALDDEFHFVLDPCPPNHTFDGLSIQWLGATYVNPPYGRGIWKWIKKGYDEAMKNGGPVVMLLPARTDTKWFHDYCMLGEIRFIRGRLKFKGARNSAPFPSMIVIFRR